MSSIEDITWAAMTEAGINTQKVTKQPTDLGSEEYVLWGDGVKVAFGPSVDMERGGTWGWSVCTYDLGPEGEALSSAEEWVETPAEVLRIVAGTTGPA